MTEISLLPFVEIGGPSRRTLLRRRALAHKGLLTGITLLALMILVALSASLLAPHDPYAQDLGRRLIPPIWHPNGTWTHPLGTDNLGRGYLSRTIYGARISLLIGISVMMLS